MKIRRFDRVELRPSMKRTDEGYLRGEHDGLKEKLDAAEKKTSGEEIQKRVKAPADRFRGRTRYGRGIHQEAG